MEKDLFFKGIRPAVNVGSSVSRVGSKAQPYALKIVTGNIKYQLAQYREYSVFAQFDNDIDEVTRGILNRGALLTEILKQAPNAPLELYKQVTIILASAFGFIANFIKDYKKDLGVISLYEKSFYDFLKTETVLNELYSPFFNLLHYADKKDFTFNTNPLLFCIKYFNEDFYDSEKAVK